MAKHREFDREVTVYVWRYRGVGHFGHAAVKMTGVQEEGNTYGELKAFVSWWPGRSTGLTNVLQKQKATISEGYKDDMNDELSERAQEQLQNGTYTPRTGQRVVWQNSKNQDVYGQEAEAKIKLPAAGTNGLKHGLDVVRMYEWWQVFRHCPHPRYRMCSTNSNCAGVAALALLAGGAAAFVDPPQATLFITPNQIEDWARALRTEIDARNQAEGVIRRHSIIVEPGSVGYRPSNDKEVMTLQEWKKLSSSGPMEGSVRSEKIRKLDELLGKYHSRAWDTDRHIEKKLKALGRMMDTIHSYLRHKPNSSRGDAILTLGKQVVNVIDVRWREFRHRIESPEKYQFVDD